MSEMVQLIERLLCDFGWHDYPGHHYEIGHIFSKHGIWYMRAHQQCLRYRCEVTQSVTVLTHKKLPK